MNYIKEYLLKKDKYSDLGLAESIGQGLKYSVEGPIRAIGDPLTIPASMIGAGGGLKRSDISDLRPSPTREALQFFANPNAAAIKARISEVMKIDPKLGKELVKKLVEQSGSGGIGTSEAARIVNLVSRGVSTSHSIYGPLEMGIASAVARSGGRVRFAEGLKGDKPGFMRRWVDPTGYSTKGISKEKS